MEQVLRGSRDVELTTEVNVYNARIEPIHASKIIPVISKEYPLGPLSFLKRARKSKFEGALDIILAKEDDTTLEELKHFLNSIGPLFTDPVLVPVPALPPRTREDYLKWMIVWPTSFHKNSDTELSPLSKEDEAFALNMLETVAINAKLSEKNQKFRNAAIIVNPKTNKIVCEALDKRMEHRLMHSVMLCIETLSKISKKYRTEKNYAELEKIGNDAYLCKDLDMYIFREPCAMCAMALVHSRIGRAFYMESCLEHGSLGSNYGMHAIKNLNHRFKVYKKSIDL